MYRLPSRELTVADAGGSLEEEDPAADAALNVAAEANPVTYSILAPTIR